MKLLGQLVKSLNPKRQMQSGRMFRAYEAGELETMMKVAQNQSLNSFNEMRYEDLTLLHKVCFDGNLQALQMLSDLPFFSEVID